MKKKKETIKKGIIALLVSQILIKIIGLAYKLYLTNKDGFGDAGNAIYSSGFQIYALLLTFSSTGVPNAISKLVSERTAIGDNRGAHRIFKIAFFTYSLFGLLGTILLFINAKFIAHKLIEIPEAEYCLVTLSPSIFFVSISAVIRGYFNGMQNFTITAKSQTIEQIFKTVFTIFFVEIIGFFSKNNTVLMAGIANLATTFATITSFAYIYIYYKSKRKQIAQDIFQSVNYVPTRIRKTLKKILKQSLPVSLSSLMSSFNKNIDLFTVVKLLRKYLSEQDAKIQYGILSGKIDTLCILPLALNIPFVTGMIPEISKAVAKKDEIELNKKIIFYMKTSLVISIPITILLFIFSKQILNILFPNANSGYMLLKLNSISIFFMMTSQTINGILQGIGKSNIPLIAYIFGAIIKFLLNIILIQNEKIGIKGAIIANIIYNMSVCIIGYVAIKINVKIDLKKEFLKILFAIFLMSICSIFLHNIFKKVFFEKISSIIAISIGTAVYVLAVIKFSIFKKGET